MNLRQGSLLRALLAADEFFTCDHYADALGCSEKTVRTDAKALDAFLEREGFAARIVAKRGAGIRLSPAPEEANRLARLLDEYEVAMHPRLERLCQEMIMLLCSPGEHSVAALSRRLFANAKQIQADLHWWKDALPPHGVALTTGRGVAVEGPEWAVRKLAMTILLSFSPNTVKRRIEPLLTGGKSYDQPFYERCVDGAQEALGFQLSGNARWQMIVYLKVAVARMGLGRAIDSHKSIHRLSPYFAELRERLARHFDVEVAPAEMQLLQDMHLCCTWQWSSKLIQDYEPDGRATKIGAEIAEALEESFRRPLPKTHRKPLAIIVESGLVRKACGLVVPDPNEKTVKYDNMDGFCMLSSVLGGLPSLQEEALHGSDYSRIVLVLLEYLEQAGCQRQYRVGLVVNCGIDLALHGRYRIEKLLSRVRIADILTENEVQAACMHADQQRLFERFDFLVSFEPLVVDFPNVAISRAIDERDIERIVAAIPLWRGGRKTEAPCERRVLRPASPNAGLSRGLYRELTRIKAISLPYGRFAWLFESLFFAQGAGLVFTLCGADVLKTSIQLFEVKGFSAFMGRPCTRVAVLLVRMDDRDNLTPMTEQFKRLVLESAQGEEVGEEDGFLLL